MVKTEKDKFKYRNDMSIKQIRTNFMVIIYYLFLIWLWQFTLSFQSSMYALMNTSVFLMMAFGAVALFVCKEDRDAIIKHTKNQILYYLLVTFIYDMFFKIVVNDMIISSSLGEVDPALLTARQFMMAVSTMIKIGFPIAYFVWTIQKFGVYKSGFTKKKQMETLRDIRENKIIKGIMDNKDSNIDRY